MQQRDELELLNSRVTIVLCLVIVAFGILIFGFWRTQIRDAPYYRQRAERNRIQDIPVTAPRGRIYDREHRILADNVPAYNLSLMREDSLRSSEETIALLAPGMEVSEHEMLARVADASSEPAHQPVLLRRSLSESEIHFVRARKYEMPELRLEFRPQRRYRNGEVAAHLLGYVGEITPDQLGSDAFEGRKSGDIVGTSGLEREYDSVLQGTDGVRRVIVNTFQREIGEIGAMLPVPGTDLVTTIDLDLQLAAEEALGDETGVVVALVPATGEVLALSSRPAFDPTAFSQGIGQAELDALIADPRHPFQNRAIQNRYSPGSIFKIFMTAAGLQEQVVDLNENIVCHGHTTLYGNRFNCWNGSGHGPMTIRDALIHSCNVFFYLVGDRLGIDRIAEHAMRMGLGRRTGIDLPNEDPGLIPTQQWKRETQSAPWYPGETISVSIGQGAVGVTPLQLAWAVGGIAVGGNLVQPHIVSPEQVQAAGFEVEEPVHEPYPLETETLDAVREALWGVVNAGGTGVRARVNGFEVAGKTGTAQVVSSENSGDNPALQPHGWFVGFAPYDAPEIVVVVFVENGGSSSASVPVAQKVLQTYFDKRVGGSARNAPDEIASLN